MSALLTTHRDLSSRSHAKPNLDRHDSWRSVTLTGPEVLLFMLLCCAGRLPNSMLYPCNSQTSENIPAKQVDLLDGANCILISLPGLTVGPAERYRSCTLVYLHWLRCLVQTLPLLLRPSPLTQANCSSYQPGTFWQLQRHRRHQRWNTPNSLTH